MRWGLLLGWVAWAMTLPACSEDEQGGMPSGAGAGGSAGDGGGGMAASGGAGFEIVSPLAGAEVLGSTVVRMDVRGIDLGRVDFTLDGGEDSLCSDDATPFECFVDLSTYEVGASLTFVATGFSQGIEVASDQITVERASIYADICIDGEGQNLPVIACLHELRDTGAAAGNMGDRYDNRDDGLTELDTVSFPDVTLLSLGYGASGIGSAPENRDPSHPLVGNASLCVSADAGWCEGLVRSMMRAGLAPTLYDLYAGSNFYWFPEHRDHDEDDLAFYMVPFVNSSQGSAGSEMGGVRKWLATLAALPPTTKSALADAGTLMPTIQMIYRRTRVDSDLAYLSPAAHANAYDALSGHRLAMVRMAHRMTADELPPMAKLAVVSESWSAAERRIDTPVAVARQWQGNTDTARTMVVEAADSFDPSGRPLSYLWRIVRGSADGVRITPRDGASSVVEIAFDWHAEESIDIGGSTRASTLAVVALFVHNGSYLSAPAFVSSSTQQL